jgi:hypothetical protein
MKDTLGLGGVDILGHTEYIGILPGRTCIDGIKSIDTMDLHRLFANINTFELADQDPLINAFADYVWIVTFLGEPNSGFEQNLIFTANCSHSAEVVTLSMKPPGDFSGHLTDFYTQQFIDEGGLSLQSQRVERNRCLIKTTKTDVNKGEELLREMGLDTSEKPVVIHPGSGGLHKCWHLDNFLSVGREISSRGVEAIFLLGPAEVDRFGGATIKKISNVAECLTDLSLTQVLSLLSCADGFVGNDSGITHLAAASGVKTLAVFGPTDPTIYGPIGPDVTILSSDTKDFSEKPSESLQRKVLQILMA